ncbi:MAG: tRNA threonylcarbamoyladenosine dehydratase [Clostridia bacterium]|nr:tRNA threonylcarbamoyladenosine dehydratase [Clostridia bacterium]
MSNQFNRTELLIGKDGIKKLNDAKVAVFGLGGVGSYVVEGLARAGIGHFVLIDDDKICQTNINRQILATTKTVGKPKVDVAKERILDINPNAQVEIYQEFFMPDSRELLDESIDYVVDAIDTVSAKIELVVRANRLNIPIISCMGTGNKLDPTRFEVTDIYKTSVCPLAKVMRKELRAREIKKLKVVYSKEEPIQPDQYSNASCKTNCVCPAGTKRTCAIRNQVPGSISFVPSVAGLIIAGEVIKDIINLKK